MNQEQPRNKMRMRSVNISKAISVLVALLVLRLFWVQTVEILKAYSADFAVRDVYFDL